MEALHGSPYVPRPLNTSIYPASGAAIDWTYREAGMHAVLFELRDRGQHGFLLPTEQNEPAAQEAMAGILSLATP
jgi:hypothetical protein